MGSLGAEAGEVLSAYCCIRLFDSVGWELTPQDRGCSLLIGATSLRKRGKPVVLAKYNTI